MTISVTRQQAIERLKEGHTRFLTGCGGHVHTDALRRRETSEYGQHPFASILSCSDSRVPAEIIFDQGIGDLFVVRVPGNVCNSNQIGALEYGIEYLKTPLCVVLGHTKCGAVTGVVKGHELTGHLGSLIETIKPIAKKVREGSPLLNEAELVETVARDNVRQSVKELLAESQIIQEKIQRGLLRIVGAIYDIETGNVEWEV